MSNLKENFPETGNAFTSQFELLKQELNLIDLSIRQVDETTKNIKNWSIVTWTASIGFALSTSPLTPYIWVTAAIPLLFFFVDASYRRIQRTFIARSLDIAKFINSEQFTDAAEKRLPFSFELMKFRRREHSWETSIIKVMFFRTVSLLYIGLATISILVWVVSRN